jgi:hypothetical protein
VETNWEGVVREGEASANPGIAGESVPIGKVQPAWASYTNNPEKHEAETPDSADSEKK